MFGTGGKGGEGFRMGSPQRVGDGFSWNLELETLWRGQNAGQRSGRAEQPNSRTDGHGRWGGKGLRLKVEGAQAGGAGGGGSRGEGAEGVAMGRSGGGV